MTKEEFKELLSEDPHSVADLIREGEFTFDFLEEMDIYLKFPKIIMGAVLSHPDCTSEFFIKKYSYYRVGSGIAGDSLVLPSAKVLENLEVIASVVGADEPTISSIFERYESKRATFRSIALNPYVSIDFKTGIYEMTGDERVLPKTAKDLFIF